MPGAQACRRLAVARRLVAAARELARHFDRRRGIDLEKPIVTSCGSGVTAAVITLALESLGHKDNRLYDGSWSEWGGTQ